MSSQPRPQSPPCILCGAPMTYFGTWSDEELDCFDPDRATIMIRYLCFACASRTEITCGTADVDSPVESQDEKDRMVSSRVADMLGKIEGRG